MCPRGWISNGWPPLFGGGRPRAETGCEQDRQQPRGLSLAGVHADASPSGVRLAEDTLFQDRAAADRPPDRYPQTPRVRRRGAETDGQRANRRATIQVHGAAVHVRPRDVVDAVTDPASHHLDTEIPGLVPQGLDVLELPQVAGTCCPVAADSQFAELEPRSEERRVG